MTRIDRWLFGSLILAAVLVGINVYPGVSGWWTAWHAVDHFGLSLTAVTPRSDQTAIDVGLAFLNRSGVSIQILEINGAVEVNGHTVANALLRPDGLALGGNQRSEVQLSGPVEPIDRPLLDEQLHARSVVWTVTGQVEIQISGQSDSTWVPYSGTVRGG
ncbi:MAG TPA: hypothetical protein VMU89_12170 [Thermomicrobiaceae bacterium]|nr:hypothetical protein [Thermomicrobiaceae bacterium]